MPTPKKLLIVDDEVNFTKMVHAFLEDKGYKVSVANSGMEALRLLREFYFDLLMLDLNMPQIDGIHVAKVSREHRPSTKIIVITAYKEQYESELSKIKVDFLMQKPIGMNDLLEKVTALLGAAAILPEPVVTEGTPKAKIHFVEHDDAAYLNLFMPYFKAKNKAKESEYELLYSDDKDRAVTLQRLSLANIVLINTDVISSYPTILKEIQITEGMPLEIIVHGKELYAKSPDELGFDRNKVTAVEGGFYNLDYPKRLEETVREICLRYGLTNLRGY